MVEVVGVGVGVVGGWTDWDGGLEGLGERGERGTERHRRIWMWKGKGRAREGQGKGKGSEKKEVRIAGWSGALFRLRSSRSVSSRLARSVGARSEFGESEVGYRKKGLRCNCVPVRRYRLCPAARTHPRMYVPSVEWCFVFWIR